MNGMEEKKRRLLAEPYRRKIGKITFQVSSYGNDDSSETAQQLLLRMLADQVVRGELIKEPENSRL